MEFKITEDGTVVREDQTDIEITDKEEILSLEESVFRHPEFYSEQELSKKKKRLDELWKKNGLEDKEVSLLVYSVYVHPERCSAEELDKRRKRLDELWEKYGKSDDVALKLKVAKMKLDLLAEEKSDNSVLKMAMLKLRKENQ